MTARAVRVITEVAGVGRELDYLVPESLMMPQVGDRIRVPLNNRRVNAWVVEHVQESEGLKSVLKVQGFGPPPALVQLSRWAAWRWAGAPAKFLKAANPPRNVDALPLVPSVQAVANVADLDSGVWQVAPTEDPLNYVLAAHNATFQRPGSLLVLTPSEDRAHRMAARLRNRGLEVACGDDEWPRMRAGWPIVVGTRGAAFAPIPQLRGAVIVDADDEDYRSEASPTWHAVDVVVERLRRDNAPLWATSVWPSPQLLEAWPLKRSALYSQSWPAFDVVDRRERDPREGVLGRSVVDHCHRALEQDGDVAVVVILQRLGTGRLYACRKCGELARCVECGQIEEFYNDAFSCPEHHTTRANYCRFCSATGLKAVRSGVTTLARDVSLLLGQPVSEMTSASVSAPDHRVVVGTTATLYRIRHANLVVFADFDQFLLAPRASATRSAVEAMVRAMRLVGGTTPIRGSVMVQTRRPDDPLFRALRSKNFDELAADEVATHRLLHLPPYGGRAEIEGDGADQFCQQIESGLSQFRDGNRITLEAASVPELCDALALVKRPPGRLRVAVS